MSFISYAQNTEDVLLWRALQHVTPGFYIDVGANDPVEHSVTKAFYDAGWHGINIEPLPAFHDAFMEQRPRDINLAVAAGAAAGEVVLYDVPTVNGWATSAPDVAAIHRAEGYALVELRVPLRTLNDICEEHVTGEVHFLKIDVEGFEREVLLGLDLRRWRPWVMVVEATMPNSRETNHETWEALVTGHDYRFAYFDGLNRYYVAAERSELLAHLQVQANVFDAFIPAHLDRAWQAMAALQHDVQRAVELQHEAQARCTAAEDSLASRTAELQAARAQLDELERGHTAMVARASDLERQQIETAARASDLEQRNTEMAARASDLERQLHAALAGADQLGEQLRSAGVQLDASRAGAGQLGELLRSAGEQLQARDEALHAAMARNDMLTQQLNAANHWGNGLAATLDAMYTSTSWRLSRPVRMAGNVYRRLAGPGPATAPLNRAALVSAVKRSALHRLRLLAGKPAIRKYVVLPLLRVPGVKERLLHMVARLRENAPTSAADDVALLLPGGTDLSPLARQALAELERARRRSSHS